MTRLQSIRTAIEPYNGIIRFVIAMLCANYFWKLTVHGDEVGIGAVTWFGADCTILFNTMADHIATIVQRIIRACGIDVLRINGNDLHYPDTNTGLVVVWGCTAIKQSFIWLCIMCAAKGNWKKKIGFITLGWACAYLFNIFRIAVITLCVHHHPDWFEVLHTYIFKYLFYGMLFLLWLVWDKRFASSRPCT